MAGNVHITPFLPVHHISAQISCYLCLGAFSSAFRPDRNQVGQISFRLPLPDSAHANPLLMHALNKSCPSYRSVGQWTIRAANSPPGDANYNFFFGLIACGRDPPFGRPKALHWPFVLAENSGEQATIDDR